MFDFTEYDVVLGFDTKEPEWGLPLFRAGFQPANECIDRIAEHIDRGFSDHLIYMVVNIDDLRQYHPGFFSK
jgi:hypothetical protein